MLLLPVTAQLAPTSDWPRPPPSTSACLGKAAQRSGGLAKNGCCLAQRQEMLVPREPRCTGLDLPSWSPPQLCLEALGSAAPAAPELRSTPASAPYPHRGAPRVALSEGAAAGLQINEAKVVGRSKRLLFFEAQPLPLP